MSNIKKGKEIRTEKELSLDDKKHAQDRKHWFLDYFYAIGLIIISLFAVIVLVGLVYCGIKLYKNDFEKMMSYLIDAVKIGGGIVVGVFIKGGILDKKFFQQQ